MTTKRCGEKLSMWRDDVVATRTTSREAAQAAARLLGDAKEIWEHSAVETPRYDCCDDGYD